MSTEVAAETLLVRDGMGDMPERVITLNGAIASLLPVELCRKHHMIAVEYRDEMLTVVAATNEDEEAAAAVRAQTGYEPTWLIAEEPDIDAAVERLFDSTGVGSNGTTPSAEELMSHGLAVPPRLGEQLVVRGLVTEQELRAAVATQAKSGGRIGEVLVHAGALSEMQLLEVISEQSGVPTIDLPSHDAAKAPLDVIPEPVALRMGIVPVSADETTVFIAAPEVLGAEQRAEIRSHTDLKIEEFLAPRNDIAAFMRTVHADEYTERARSTMRIEHPETSADRVLSGAQKVSLVVIALIVIAGLVYDYTATLIVLFALASIYYTATSIYKMYAAYSALEHRFAVDTSLATIAAMDEHTLPKYTILVPLFREAAVIPYLTAGIESIDYPKTKLDVRLLCEAEDQETIDAIAAQDLPPHFKTIIVPPSQPQTKPKACNYGLIGAEGEYVVIYDAEDRPDPEQLKKAVLTFMGSDDSIACTQAKLNYFNQESNWLTRWFSIEYALLYELVLPGLDARKEPIPLGGTSNHIRTDLLVALGAWDPYNVTEDADLGMRLHEAGYRTTMLDSTTYEEANTRVGSWLLQRSRWIKGHLQTYLVYMRNPFTLFGRMGFRGFMSFQLLIGSTFVFLINPLFWTLTSIYTLTQANVISDLFPGWVFFLAAAQLFLGNFMFMYLGLVASARLRYDSLAPYALFLPFYWGMMSIAAVKAFFQLITNPFYWEKTEHGIDVGTPVETAAARRQAGGS